MQQIVILLHVLAAIAVVGLVLIQHGKGADAGAAFGSGASNTMFGSQGTLPFLMKLTGFLAAVFYITSLTLGYMSSQDRKQGSVMMKPAAAPFTMPTPQSSPKK